MSNKRIIITLLLAIVTILLPYWVYLPLLLAALFFIPFYWEAVLVGFLIDVLYGGAHSDVTLRFTYAFVALLIVLVMIPLRDRLRLYA